MSARHRVWSPAGTALVLAVAFSAGSARAGVVLPDLPADSRFQLFVQEGSRTGRVGSLLY